MGPIGKKAPSYDKIIDVAPPKTDAQANLAAKRILNRLATRAYRRKVAPDELWRLMELFKSSRADGNAFDASIRFALQALLVSPHFLYKVEAPVAEGTSRKLTDFELATNLSYFLWSTMPDDELLGVAAQGKLSDPDVYRAQVKRMIS